VGSVMHIASQSSSEENDLDFSQTGLMTHD